MMAPASRPGVSNAVLHSTVPLYFYIPRGKSEPEPTARIGDLDSLDLEFTLAEIGKQTLCSRSIMDWRLALVNTVSSYGRIPHLMVLPAVRRYAPALDSLPDEVGEGMLSMCAESIAWVSDHYQVDQVHVGVNAGPISIGDRERGGSQSLLPLCHMHVFFKEPPPEPGMKTAHNLFEREWVPSSALTPPQQRLLFRNGHGELLGRLIGREILAELASRPARAAGGGLLDDRGWGFDERGLRAPFDLPVKDLLTQPRFFQDVLKPIAAATGRLFRDLTEALTDMDCARSTDILKKCEQGPLSSADLAFLLRAPAVRPEPEIREAFARHAWPLDLLECVLPAVRARCEGGTEPAQMWRKGFSYSAVFHSVDNGSAGELRIMPIVYVGPAGVFEATLEVLTRLPQPAPLSELRRRSRELDGLSAWLRARAAP